MTFLTVGQLKTWVAAIPASANTWEVGFPDDTLPVLVNRAMNPNGTAYTIKAYLDPTTRTFTLTGA